MWRSIVATRRPTGSWCVCRPKLKNTSRTVKDSSDRVNRVRGLASNAAEASPLCRISRFPGEGRDPFLRHSEFLKQSQYFASEDGLVLLNDRPRLSPGKRVD